MRTNKHWRDTYKEDSSTSPAARNFIKLTCEDLDTRDAQLLLAKRVLEIFKKHSNSSSEIAARALEDIERLENPHGSWKPEDKL